MTLTVLALSFLFGLVFGSFLNVCIYRIPRDLSVVAPRSFCPECGSQLAWTQNIPLLSYLRSRGRCRQCAQPIGVRYPLVELTAAALFALIAWKYGFGLEGAKWALFELLLIALFWTDFEERILPDELTLGGTLAGLLFSVVVRVSGAFGPLMLSNAEWRWQSLVNAVLGALLVALPIWLIGALYGRLRKREALGLGDVKLLLMLGAFLGPEAGILALSIGAISGALVGVMLLIRLKGPARFYELPFGSFLCAGAAIVPFLSASLRSPLAVP